MLHTNRSTRRGAVAAAAALTFVLPAPGAAAPTPAFFPPSGAAAELPAGAPVARGIPARVAGRVARARASDPRAVAVLDTAIARMGGAAALRRIERVRFEMMTQWQRTSFDERPYTDQPSYEWHSDLRDYTRPAWRNTRRFMGGGAAPVEIINVVTDSVSIIGRGKNGPWMPLSLAYVDERRELFAVAPERALLAAREAADLRSHGDTTIGGIAHARVTATVDRYPATLFVRRADGFLAVARLRAGQPNDFGLSPWGEMEVELWFSRWQKLPLAGTGGIAYPLQWDVRRVGKPYKRITVLSADFDAPAPADSFTVSDSLRAAYFATANRAMWDVPLDSARILEGRFAEIGRPGQPGGAVKIGGQWIVLEGGIVPTRAAQEIRWLERADPGARVAGAIVTFPNLGRGGLAWLAERRIPIHAGPGVKLAVDMALRNWKAPPSAVTVVSRGRWLRVGSDSMWVEPIDLPDAPGAMVAWVPSLRWIYSGSAALPLHLDLVMVRARERGWQVERVGSFRGITQPVPAQAQAARQL